MEEAHDALDRGEAESSLESTLKALLDSTAGRSFPRASTKIKQILRHEHGSVVLRIPGHGFMAKIGEKPTYVPGLHRTLNDVLFWKDISKRRRSDYASIIRTCPTHGTTHGSLVHGELEACVKCLARKRTRDPDLPANPDACTVNILRAILANGWFPVWTEIPLWCPSARMATACDVIMIDLADDRFVLGEFKTECENTEYEAIRSDDPLPDPFSHVKDCPDTRHQFQLAAMVLILAREYGVEPDEAVVIVGRSKRRGVDVYGLADWARTPQFFADLWEVLTRTRGVFFK
jgi:hypothetical protein